MAEVVSQYLEKQESENWTQTPVGKPVTQGQVLAVLESLKANKATGCDGIPAKVTKIGAEELLSLFRAYVIANSQVTGSAWTGLLFQKRMTSILKKIQCRYSALQTTVDPTRLSLGPCHKPRRMQRFYRLSIPQRPRFLQTLSIYCK